MIATLPRNERPFVALTCFVLACLTLTGGLTGCLSLYNQEMIEPRFDLRDTSVLLVSFRDGKYWHGETERSNEFYRNILGQLQYREECASVTVLANQLIEDEIYATLEDTVDWQKYGAKAGADYVLTGSILDLRDRDSTVVGMLKGTMRFSYEIHNVSLGKKVFETQVSVRFPKDRDGRIGTLDDDQNRMQVRRGLFISAANEMANQLCGNIIDTNVPQDTSFDN